jgi:hypothetical protein
MSHAIAGSTVPDGPWPTKEDKNTHAKSFDGDSTEVEALTSHALWDVVRGCTKRHIDPKQHLELRTEEDAERRAVIDIAGRAA